MTAGFAREITTWRYPAPYERYSIAEDLDFFLVPANGYYAVVDDRNQLIAYRCYGADGRVPGGDYTADALDTGGALRPDLTGQGRGRAVMEQGLAFGRAIFDPPAFRVTVAAFNERALRMVRSAGFVETSRFAATADGEPFVVLVRQPA